MTRNWRNIAIAGLFVVLLGILPGAANAQYAWCTGEPQERCGDTTVAQVSDVGPFLCDVCFECVEFGQCQLPDVMIVGGNVGNFLLSIVGSIALAIFIWGGLLWMTAGGNPDKVKKAQRWFVGAVGGIIIAFSGALLLRVVISVIKTGAVGASPTLQNLECVGEPNGTACGNDTGACFNEVCEPIDFSGAGP